MEPTATTQLADGTGTIILWMVCSFPQGFSEVPTWQKLVCEYVRCGRTVWNGDLSFCKCLSALQTELQRICCSWFYFIVFLDEYWCCLEITASQKLGRRGKSWNFLYIFEWSNVIRGNNACFLNFILRISVYLTECCRRSTEFLWFAPFNEQMQETPCKL